MASMFILRPHVRLMQEGFEPKSSQSIPGYVNPTLRTYFVETGPAQSVKRSFQCLEDDDPYCCVAKGKEVQDSRPSDGNDSDPKGDSRAGSKEAHGDPHSQSNTGCSMSLACGSSGSDGNDDGEEEDDEERRGRKKRKEPEDALSWWSPDEQDLLQRLLQSLSGDISSSLVHLLQRLLQDRQLVGQPFRRRALRSVVIWAVRVVFGQPWVGLSSSTAASHQRSDTTVLNRSRPPELSARLRSAASGQDRRCVVLDFPLNAPTGDTGPHRGTRSTRRSIHCLFGPPSGSGDSDDASDPQLPSPSDGQTTGLTYGDMQELQGPVQCTDSNQNEATAERPRNEGGAHGFQPLSPVNQTFQLILREHILVCTHPCEELNRGEEDTIDMSRRPVLVPEDAIGNDEAVMSGGDNAAASAPWLAQLEQHSNRAANNVQNYGGGLKRPMQASEVCDKCFQREVYETLHPCRHKMCHVCRNDVYPPSSLQAFANPEGRCPVCRRTVKRIEDQNLYPTA